VNDRLLTVKNNKTQKGEKHGYLTGILYLVPANGAGLGNLCPHASQGCRLACLFTAGRGATPRVKAGRLRKTQLFFADTAMFVDSLAGDVQRLAKRATKKRLTFVVRLNGTSDIPWERVKGTNGLTLMEQFPDTQFYDYTKRPNRDTGFSNYHLTFSRSEHNETQALIELARGRNVAVVFDTHKRDKLPTKWNGYRVIDGDKTDLRFTDASGVVVGLRAKGKARRDDSGFVVKVAKNKSRPGPSLRVGRAA